MLVDAQLAKGSPQAVAWQAQVERLDERSRGGARGGATGAAACEVEFCASRSSGARPAG